MKQLQVGSSWPTSNPIVVYNPQKVSKWAETKFKNVGLISTPLTTGGMGNIEKFLINHLVASGFQTIFFWVL